MVHLLLRIFCEQALQRICKQEVKIDGPPGIGPFSIEVKHVLHMKAILQRLFLALFLISNWQENCKCTENLYVSWYLGIGMVMKLIDQVKPIHMITHQIWIQNWLPTLPKIAELLIKKYLGHKMEIIKTPHRDRIIS